MKKIALITLLVMAVIFGLVYRDYQTKKKEFQELKREFDFSLDFEQTVQLITVYFFNHGSYPDSLEQVDTLFSRKKINTDLDTIRNTAYRFLIDPFSGQFYYYIPKANNKNGIVDHYYLLSAGIDGRLDNTSSSLGEPRLYDSLYFSYFDLYFGKKDILVKQQSIRDWMLLKRGFKMSLKELIANYGQQDKKKPPRIIELIGVVQDVFSDRYIIRDLTGSAMATCYLAPFDGIKKPNLKDTIEMRGLFNKIDLEPQAVATFFNCVIIE